MEENLTVMNASKRPDGVRLANMGKRCQLIPVILNVPVGTIMAVTPGRTSNSFRPEVRALFFAHKAGMVEDFDDEDRSLKDI